MASKLKAFPYIGLLTMILSVICTLISLIPHYWVHYEKVSGNQVSKVWLGLWKYCSVSTFVSLSGTEVCYFHYEDNFPANKAFLGVTQTLVCLAFITQVVALVFSFMKLALHQDKRNIFQIIITLAVLSGLLLFCGAIVFAASVNEVDPTGTIKYSEDLHFAFAFAIISALASFAAAIVTFIEIKKDD